MSWINPNSTKHSEDIGGTIIAAILAMMAQVEWGHVLTTVVSAAVGGIVGFFVTRALKKLFPDTGTRPYKKRKNNNENT